MILQEIPAAKAPAMPCPGSRRDFQPGDNVHIYVETHYNRRGTVESVRQSDAMGRVDVRVNGAILHCHSCDLELVP